MVRGCWVRQLLLQRGCACLDQRLAAMREAPTPPSSSSTWPHSLPAALLWGVQRWAGMCASSAGLPTTISTPLLLCKGMQGCWAVLAHANHTLPLWTKWWSSLQSESAVLPLGPPSPCERTASPLPSPSSCVRIASPLTVPINSFPVTLPLTMHAQARGRWSARCCSSGTTRTVWCRQGPRARPQAAAAAAAAAAVGGALRWVHARRRD